MIIEIDNYPDIDKVEVRVIHACVILENGLPFYQETKSTYLNASVVNSSGSFAIINKPKGKKDETTSVQQSDILMIIPASMTVMKNHVAKVPEVAVPVDDFPF